jgi:adenylate kinase
MPVGPILVFGVSGVGKTSACEAYVARHPDTLFVSASTLLKNAKQTTVEALRTAGAGEIVDNQSLLAGALARFRSGRERQPVLIDAHGVIDNDAEYVQVPLSAIEALAPERLILLEAPAIAVAKRRATAVRKRPQRSVEAINAEIEAERSAVQSYATALGLELTIINVGADFSYGALLDEAVQSTRQ